MRISSSILTLGEVPSTQLAASKVLRESQPYQVVYALHQRAGRGRFDRVWVSELGSSLTATFIFSDYPSPKEPWLFGMVLAVVAAESLNLSVQWPNDLVIGTKKVGGILTEMVPNAVGQQVPIVGIGINLNQTSFHPEIAHRATSLRIERGEEYKPRDVLELLIKRVQQFPDPTSWADISERWSKLDATTGKLYKMHDGTTAEAYGVDESGALIAIQDGERKRILAADALFGVSKG
jgi:BirA family biotin operon repressor/biotin-[acetyl-CoA-carboxylase] ligase